MMKKFIVPVVLFMALVFCISSCKKDDVSQTNSNSQTSQNASTTPSRSSERKCDNDNHNQGCGNQGCNNQGCTGHYTPTCGPAPSTCGSPAVENLIEGQNTIVGTVSVANDGTNLYVTYTISSGYRIQGLHLYVGDTSHIPCGYSGEPNCQEFPCSSTQCGTCSQYTFTIPLTSCQNQTGCFIIAAEADVCGSGSNSNCFGGFGFTQTCWAGGTHFSGSRCHSQQSSYFTYCKQSCNVCILPPNILFGGEATWPNGATSVTVGGYTYTVSSINSVLAEPSNDAQAALFAVATLKLYGSSISPTSAVTSASTVVENWLSTVGQLTATSSFTAPSNVEAAIATIQAWEASDYCQ